MLKSKIRKKILKIRKKKNNQNLKLSFSKISKYIKKKIVGGYFPVNSEIDTLDFLKKLEQNGKQICLPVVKNNNKMDFYLWSFKD